MAQTMAQPNPQDIFVEVLYAFGAEAGRYGCTLNEGATESMRTLFTYTVEQAVRTSRENWKPAARHFVLKQTARIGRQAARAAMQTPGREITRTIFIDAAQEVIALQQLVCERLAKDNPDMIIPSGPFCVTLRDKRDWAQR